MNLRWLDRLLTYAPKAYDVVADIVDNVKRRRRNRAAAERAAHDAAVMDQLNRDKRRAADEAREREIMNHWSDIDRRKPR